MSSESGVDADQLAAKLASMLASPPDAGESQSRDSNHWRHDRMSEEERVLSELANVVNSKAYRSRGPSRSLSQTLPPGAIPDIAADSAEDEHRVNTGVDVVASLAHTEQHLDPNTDLVEVATLGEGAFATVDLCKTSKRHIFPRNSHAAKTGLVAAKRLKPECIAEDPLEFDNFLSEAALVKTLVHKNVIECYGCIEYRDQVNGQHCVLILLEYLQGGSLRARIAKRDYDGFQAIRWLLEIAEGMSYLHQVANIGVAHRDLKPDNILLDECGTAKIADMGMARIAMRTEGVTENIELSQNYQSASRATAPKPLGLDDSFSVTCRTGTPRYMAPENWAGMSYTYKVDVFSYAILAYEVLSGQRAYAELMMNGQALADAVAENGLRPIIPSDWPPALITLLRLCWSSEPEERPDFTEVVDKLKEIEADVLAHPAMVAGLVSSGASRAANRTGGGGGGAAAKPAAGSGAKKVTPSKPSAPPPKLKAKAKSSMCVVS